MRLAAEQSGSMEPEAAQPSSHDEDAREGRLGLRQLEPRLGLRQLEPRLALRQLEPRLGLRQLRQLEPLVRSGREHAQPRRTRDLAVIPQGLGLLRGFDQ